MSGATRSYKELRRGSSPEPSEGAQPCKHLDFRLLGSRQVREYIGVALTQEPNMPHLKSSLPVEMLSWFHLKATPFHHLSLPQTERYLPL